MKHIGKSIVTVAMLAGSIISQAQGCGKTAAALLAIAIFGAISTMGGK